MTKNLLLETTIQSFDGTKTFPEIVRALMADGVESYHVDLIQNRKVFYGPGGETMTEDFDFSGPQAAESFHQDAVMSAIRQSQAGEIKYPKFLEQILAAGTMSYTVYIKGRKAIYFGRKGEFHVETFPQ